MQPNDPDRDPVYEEFLREVTHGLPWHSAQKLLESIEQNRKAKADAIAKRLLGRFQTFTCPRCWRKYEDSLDDLRCSLDAQQSYGNTGFCCEPCKEDHGN